jgi:choline dehydrogenase-like flavoprotein
MDSYDAIVVGSGACGGWAAKELTENGLRVLVLEAGPDHDAAEREEGGSAAPTQPIQSRSYAHGPETAHLFVDDADHPYSHPADRPFAWIRGRQVGGRLHVWAGMSPRLSDHDLAAARRDGAGEDWPIAYADLAPYYDRVERQLGVRGMLPLSPGELSLKQAVEGRWDTRQVTGPPIATAPAATTLAAAARTRRLTLRPDSVVTRVLVGHESSRARGVAFADRLTGREEEVAGRVVFLCASTIESTRLLLASATRDHPNGLANSSGVLGLYLTDHTFGVGIDGVAPLPTGQAAAGTPHGAAIPAFRNVTEHDVDFLRGYGARLLVDASGRFWMRAFGEVLPRAENRIELDPARLDRWGVPTVRIDCAYGDNERLMAADQVACLSEMAEAAGFAIEAVHPDPAPPGSSSHELGTARMGRDPRSSVLNSFNQAWDVENLFVTDGASFTSAGHQNPTLTMMALTSRACDYAVARLRRREL